MDRTERFYRIERLLRDQRVVPTDVFLKELEVSPATFKRDLEYLRERLNAPIVWDRDLGGYRFDKQEVGDKYELPGLWLSAAEIYALLTMQHLLKDLGPGLLIPYVEPLLNRLRGLLAEEHIPAEAFEKRIRIHRMNARTYEPEHFLPVVTAVLQRKRLVLEHYNKSRDETSKREVSPQRLSHYRDNWYVDCFCHLRNEIRRFSLDGLRDVWLQDQAAIEINEETLKETLDSGYGIFSGVRLEWAELVFSPSQARWVSRELWHPEQQGWFSEDGYYHLTFPFRDTRELAMDIMRYAPEVQVMAPVSLREALLERLKKAVAVIEGGSSHEPALQNNPVPD